MQVLFYNIKQYTYNSSDKNISDNIWFFKKLGILIIINLSLQVQMMYIF